MKYINKIVYGSILTLLLSSSSYADCTYELFSISSTKNTKIIDFVEQLSDECEFSVIVTDPKAEDFLQSKLNKTHLKNLTIDEVLNIILKENNLFYTLESNVLKISYLKTEVFNIDYILTQRTGKGKADASLSSIRGGGEGGATEGNSADSGMVILSSDEVVFWEKLDEELQSVINRPHDVYEAGSPIINKNAGLITVTATARQLKRLSTYLKKLQDKVSLQVLIDVQILSVTLSTGQETGINWKKLYSFANFSLDTKASFNNPINTILDTATGGSMSSNSRAGGSLGFSTNGNVNLLGTTQTEKRAIGEQSLIGFLKDQGDVVSISNPKILTLNNQPALITAGTEYFYTIKNVTQPTAIGGVVQEEHIIESVFAGVLLSITPEISDDDMITLKINPSLSETTGDAAQLEAGRNMPPDLVRRQLSSVVTVKDGNRIILGGLIRTSNKSIKDGWPILGDIPVLDYVFSYESKTKVVEELVIVIQPHIIKKADQELSLSKLGYVGIVDDSIKINKSDIILDKK